MKTAISEQIYEEIVALALATSTRGDDWGVAMLNATKQWAEARKAAQQDTGERHAGN